MIARWIHLYCDRIFCDISVEYLTQHIKLNSECWLHREARQCQNTSLLITYESNVSMLVDTVSR